MRARVLMSVLLGVVSVVSSYGAGTSITTLSYDHLSDPSAMSFDLSIGDGQPFRISIKNTLPAAFSYTVAGVPLSADFGAASSPSEADLVEKDIDVIHERKFGGYIVTIHSLTGPVEVAMKNGTKKTLRDATLIVVIHASGWNHEIAGAFTATSLTDPVYSVAKRTVAGQEANYVVRDRDKEDRVSPGIAAFITAFNTNLPWLGATFGIGITQGGKSTYYAAPTIRFSSHMAISAGFVAGPVARLPNGVSVNGTVTDANALASMSTRNRVAGFVGFSYSFINPGDVLTKPFAGASTAGGGATPAVSAPAATAKSSNKTPPVVKPTQPADPLAPVPAPPTPNSHLEGSDV